MKLTPSHSSYILYISSYPPRECGIATFTQDLTTAFEKQYNPIVKPKICALKENPATNYHYDAKVIREIAASELEQYVALARDVNNDEKIKLVDLQHEFGLFGGRWGNYLIPFLQVLEKPLVSTFHTILPKPSIHAKKIIQLIAKKARAVVVMNKLSQEILATRYAVPRTKIAFIPHGIPQVPFEPSKNYKKELHLDKHMVLSTFGLLSKNKGIEYAIRALPQITKRFPNVLYLILGITHPVVRRKEGEQYRNFLMREVERLHLKDHVRFYNKYLTFQELTHFLRATDIYISPSVAKTQSVSGTLSYALGCGRPVISTATQYGKYIVDKGNGILVRCGNSSDISKALDKLLSSEKTMKTMAKNAYAATRPMTWPNVAQAYFRMYQKFADIKSEKNKFPEIKLDHLLRLTDNFGVLQFAKYTKPQKKYGYAVDDNARALLVCAMNYKKNQSAQLVELMNIYLNFLQFTQGPNGSFASFVSSRRQKDDTFEEDVQGRTIWALGYAASQQFLPTEISAKALKLFKKAFPRIKELRAPRSIAFAMLGLSFYFKRFPREKQVMDLLKKFADYLVELYDKNSLPDWEWFEDQLTYSNSKLPEALLYAYDLTRTEKYLRVAQTALRFLRSITFENEYYIPIGQNGWYVRNEKRAYFDQQPEDAASMVETQVLAYAITKNASYLEDALCAFQWFLGKNHLQLMVYDETTGGCHDGIGQYSLNLNQGAESTISYLLSRLSIGAMVDEEKEKRKKSSYVV
ncbi:MAG: glycosyltransferase [Patescibacteria group bacterium]